LDEPEGLILPNSVKETAVEAAIRKALHGYELLPLSRCPAAAVLRS